MCGLLVIFNHKKINFSKDNFITLLNSINHRGPDNVGVFTDENILIGLNRLSIQDLTMKANQPMVSQNKNYVIVFNGEIYNLKKLKKKYFENFKFKTSSDTELLLEGYVKYGKSFFNYIAGMWSVVIYDTEKRKLIISRDRLGIKPLYYSRYNDDIIISSEQKTILKYFEINKLKKSLNSNYINKYISLANTDFQNDTIYNDIFSFKPGTFCELKNNFYNHYEFWKLEKKIVNKNNFSLNKFENLFGEVIEQHLTSDVKISTTLSYGIDSSLLTFFLKKNFLNKNLKSYSLKFDFFEDEESKLISKLVVNEKINHQFIDINKENLKKEFDNFLNYSDEPIVSDNQFYQYLLLKKVKEEYKVILTGDGADEVFFGYDKLINIYIYQLIKNLNLYELLNFIKKNNLHVNKKLYKIITSCFNIFISRKGLRSTQENIFGKEILNMSFFKEKVDHPKLKNKNLLYQEFHERFLFDIPKILHNQDITGMANSVEVRVPYLDHRLLDYVCSIDFKSHFKNYRSKSILKELGQKYLPAEIINYKKKYKKPGSINYFVYNILNKNIQKYLLLNSNPNYFSSNLINSYLKDKKNNNISNSYVWFRYYQINKLKELKNI